MTTLASKKPVSTFFSKYQHIVIAEHVRQNNESMEAFKALPPAQISEAVFFAAKKAFGEADLDGDKSITHKELADHIKQTMDLIQSTRKTVSAQGGRLRKQSTSGGGGNTPAENEQVKVQEFFIKELFQALKMGSPGVKTFKHQSVADGEVTFDDWALGWDTVAEDYGGDPARTFSSFRVTSDEHRLAGKARLDELPIDEMEEDGAPPRGSDGQPIKDVIAAAKVLITEEEINKIGIEKNFEELSKLAPEDTEKILSYLTVPELAIPLVLEFFAQGRISSLISEEMQAVVASALFQMGDFVEGNFYGPLINEVSFCPAAVYGPLLQLCHSASAFCAGGSFKDLFLFVVRTAVQVHLFSVHADRHLYEEQKSQNGQLDDGIGVPEQALLLLETLTPMQQLERVVVRPL